MFDLLRICCRIPGEESDESSRETSSDGSSDCETERGACNFAAWNQQELADSTQQDMKALSLRYKPFNGSSSDEGDFSSSPGVLTFEYFERDPPYSREPLADKVSSPAPIVIFIFQKCCFLVFFY